MKINAKAKVDGKPKKTINSFVLPAQGHHSSGFGMHWGRMHNGIDIANATGTPIVASKSGRVVFAGWDEGYGYYVEIQHDDSSRARYAHLSKIMVKENQKIETAQRIGLMGSTGRSTGPHLHFEIIDRNGAHVDPHLLERVWRQAAGGTFSHATLRLSSRSLGHGLGSSTGYL